MKTAEKTESYDEMLLLAEYMLEEGEDQPGLSSLEAREKFRKYKEKFVSLLNKSCDFNKRI